MMPSIVRKTLDCLGFLIMMSIIFYFLFGSLIAVAGCTYEERLKIIPLAPFYAQTISFTINQVEYIHQIGSPVAFEIDDPVKFCHLKKYQVLRAYEFWSMLGIQEI